MPLTRSDMLVVGTANRNEGEFVVMDLRHESRTTETSTDRKYLSSVADTENTLSLVVSTDQRVINRRWTTLHTCLPVLHEHNVNLEDRLPWTRIERYSALSTTVITFGFDVLPIR